MADSRTNRSTTSGFTTIEVAVSLGLVTILVLIVFRVGTSLYGGGIKLVRDLELATEANMASKLIARDFDWQDARVMGDTLFVLSSLSTDNQSVKYAFSNNAILRNGKSICLPEFALQGVRLDLTLTRSLSDTCWDKEVLVVPWMEIRDVEGDFQVSAIDLSFDICYRDLKKHVELFRLIQPFDFKTGPFSLSQAGQN